MAYFPDWATTAVAATIAAAVPGLVVDNFAGGGGTSTGIEQALGRAVDIAINHDAEALAMHEINHPGTTHIKNNIWRVDPKEATQGRKVGLAWFSPDCTHHSKARGGKPRLKSIRDLSWVVVLWAQQVRPDVIFMENVEEIRSWGPLDDDGLPIKERAGETWTKWLTALRKAGYRIQFKELRACDYGAPTIRKRLFLIARCDGKAIRWPKPTHGKPGTRGVISGKLLPYRTAADSVIDFSIKCPSIFTRKKALADNTLRRIAHGIMKFVVNCDDPFIIPLTHAGGPGRAYPSTEPVPTITGANRGELAVIAPHITKFRTGAIGHDAREPLATVTANSFVKRPGGAPPLGLVGATLINTRNGEREGQAPRARSMKEPAPTVTAIGSQGAVAEATLERLAIHGLDCLTTAHVVQHSETRPGRKPNAGHDAREPVSTIVQRGPLQALATSNIVKLKGTCRHGHPSDEPLATVGAQGTHLAEVETELEPLPLSEEALVGANKVYAFLLKYYGNEETGHGLSGPLGTVTTLDRFALVTVTINGEQYAIVDIGMRMLTPRELYNAQGFPPDYIIEFEYNGKPLTKSAQIEKCGNSVCPPMSRALVAANFPLSVPEARAEDEKVAA
ncbi:MAG: (cytosine-5)-methyltransferase 1 [Sphingomonadales bacterium]|jgi:DNA (cytosine-5)-methyltransferase 1|nr:(cytosine-5)-methyltransferase 1 [Sphingomonadales bacterium]